MYIQFLVEDVSGSKLLDAIMKKYITENPTIFIDYRIFPYKGIGGLQIGSNAANVKSQQLLSDLPKRLQAFDIALKSKDNAILLIVLDNDTQNTNEFEAQLNGVAERSHITIDYAFCIAVEEMEAWLLGDRAALQAAYPKISDRIATKLANYQQDSIVGTWELLADMLTKQGLTHFKKLHSSSFDVGRCKSEWAENIGIHLDIRQNVSPSFRHLLSVLDEHRG